MKEISLEESKEIQIGIMKFIHNFCVKNNIRYSLAYGSAIGAIRHNGFIRWDDDIVIMLLREDYNRFITLFEDADGVYKLRSLENDKNYVLPFAKVEDTRTVMEESSNLGNTGIFVDVFPVDDLFDGKEESIRFVLKLSFLKKCYISKTIRSMKSFSLYKIPVLWLLKIILVFVPVRFLAEKWTMMGKKGKEGSGYVASLYGAYKEKEVMERNIFSTFITVPFEKEIFFIVEAYDRYLCHIYGDYMKLPPEDKRHSPHGISKIYWKK